MIGAAMRRGSRGGRQVPVVNQTFNSRKAYETMTTPKRILCFLTLVFGVSATSGVRGAQTPDRSSGGPRTGRPTGTWHQDHGLSVAQNYPQPGEEVADPGVAYPSTPPPDLIPEYRPPAPGYGYLWIDGYWDWTGYDWAWNSGFWTPRQAGIAFSAPRFVFIDGEPVYYRGYWVDPYGRREYGYGWRGAPPAAWRARPSVMPVAWRAQHSDGWRRVPGAPSAWRAPIRREGVRGGYPGEQARRFDRGSAVGRAEPGRPGFEHGPSVGHVEPGRPGGAPAPFAGGWHGGQAPHPGEAVGANRAPAVAGPHSGPGPAAHPMAAPAPHPAPAAHAAPTSRRK
jgi:hypothetical protein